MPHPSSRTAVYTVSDKGKAVVIQAEAQWEIIRVNDMADRCKGTPAIVDDKMYLRT